MALANETKQWLGAVLTMVAIALASGSLYYLSHRTSAEAPAPEASSLADLVGQLEKATERDPANRELQQRLGDAYFDKKEYPGAIKAYQAVLALEPGRVDARVDMATAYYYEGQLAVAAVQLQKALKQDPGHLKGLFNLGVVYHSLGLFPEAKAAWQKASRLAPDAETKSTIDAKLRQLPVR